MTKLETRTKYVGIDPNGVAKIWAYTARDCYFTICEYVKRRPGCGPVALWRMTGHTEHNG